jgi:uncharacterized protein YegJ (DUF2314 family)
VYRLTLMVLAATLTLSACGNQPGHVTERPGEPDVVAVEPTDPEMTQASSQARDTLGEFVRRLDEPPESQSSTSLKVRLTEGDVVEHLWLVSVSHAGDSFTGVVNNEPVNLKAVHLGQSVTVPKAQISDWLAVDNGRLVAGYTLRVLRNRMNPAERKEFDAQLHVAVD